MTRKEDAKGGQGGRRRNGGRRNGGRRTRGGCDFVEEKRFHAKKEKDEAQDVIMRKIRRLRMKKMRRRKRRKRRRRKKRGGRE